MDRCRLWCVILLAVGVAACSGRPHGDAAPSEAAAESPTMASATTVSTSVAPGPASAAAATSIRGLRASYEACIDRAAAVIPATQACIDDEAEFQRSRLGAVVERLKREHPDRADALEYQQAAWRADMEARCAWDAESEGQQQRIEANMCTLEETARRADTLDH